MKKLLYGVTIAVMVLAPMAIYTAQDGLAPKAQQLADEAKKVEQEATAISQTLRPRQFDVEQVKGMLTKLEDHVGSVERMVAGLAAHEGQMTAQQKSKYEAVKMKSDLLGVFTKNKKDLLLGSEPEKNRSMIRAKADGIAKRAGMLQQSALAMTK